jgi:hypothetical protein
MGAAIFRFASEYASRIIGVTLGYIVITGIVGAWSYTFSHQVWLDRTITAAIAIGLVGVTTAILAYIRPPVATGLSQWEAPTAVGLLGVIDELRTAPRGRMKLKFFATNQGISTAEILVQIFRQCNWEIEVNHDDGSYVFPAPAVFNGARLRYRENRACEYLTYPIFQTLTNLVEVPQTKYFPDTDAFNFVQIEIGDTPS